MSVRSIKSQIQWKAFRSPTGKVWIAQCDPLGLTVEAKTLDELYSSAIPEALRDLLTDLIEDGDLDEFLREMGWDKVNTASLLSFAEDSSGTEAPMPPWDMIAGTGGGEACDLEQVVA